MADLVILRLHPTKPMAPADFRTVLTGLQIDVYDLSFGDSLQGVLLGSASGLANPHLTSTTNNQVNINTTSILQHYLDITDLLGGTTRHLESAATAVVVASPPVGHQEYPNATGYDLRLEITGGSGLTILDHHLDFNVEVTTVGGLSTSQKVYFGMAASAYVELPATARARPQPLPSWTSLRTGQPPAFDQLVHAIDLVLGGDPERHRWTRLWSARRSRRPRAGTSRTRSSGIAPRSRRPSPTRRSGLIRSARSTPSRRSTPPSTTTTSSGRDRASRPS